MLAINLNSVRNINFAKKLTTQNTITSLPKGGRYLSRANNAAGDVFVRSSSVPNNIQTNNSNYAITRDNFTGLRDKHYLLLRLQEKMDEALSKNKPLKVAMFDMDNFKSINEILSYEVGDKFIQEIAHTVQNSAREHHLGSYRFGGEEFVLIFSDENDDEVNNICSAIQKSLLSNEKMKSYMSVYEAKLQKKLAEDEKETSFITRLKELKFYISAYEDLAKADESGQIRNNPTFNELLDRLKNSLEEHYEIMLETAAATEKDVDTKATLIRMDNLLKSTDDYNSKTVVYNNETLDEYFSARYDKSAEIYQIKKWQKDFDRANGFSITCGIVNFEPDDIKKLMPEDILEMVGERLKEGKHEKKGQIYS